MKPRKSYWHLEAMRRKPSDYEIVTSALLYYPARGFEVQTPVADWYRRHQGSGLDLDDWEKFSDPRETTYSHYVELMKRRETFVEALLERVETSEYDQKLSARWVERLEAVLPTLRFPLHGLQMVAAYLGQMAPSGRLVVASLFQAADEIRRVQWLAYRMRQIQRVHPGFGGRSRSDWEQRPEWQPLRALIEQLLVTYGFGEALVALNLVVKPAFDALFLKEYAKTAELAGDEVLSKVLGSMEDDGGWHREWVQAFAHTAMEQDAANRKVIQDWIYAWWPRVRAAIEAASVLTSSEGVSASLEAERACSDCWRQAGIDLGRTP